MEGAQVVFSLVVMKVLRRERGFRTHSSKT